MQTISIEELSKKRRLTEREYTIIRYLRKGEKVTLNRGDTIMEVEKVSFYDVVIEEKMMNLN